MFDKAGLSLCCGLGPLETAIWVSTGRAEGFPPSRGRVVLCRSCQAAGCLAKVLPLPSPA